MAKTIVMTLVVNAVVFGVLFLIWLGIRRILDKKLSAVMVFSMWAIVAVKLVLPFGFESQLSPLGWFDAAPVPIMAQVLETEPETGQRMPYESPTAENTGSERLQPSDQNDRTLLPLNQAEPVPSQLLPKPLRWAEWALVVWSAGVSAYAGWCLLCRFQVSRRIIRKACPAPDSVLRLLDECQEQLGIRRKVKVCVQKVIAMPAITGLFRPVLIMSESALELDDNGIRYILLHELMHYKKGDLALIKLMNLLNALYWFQPLVWLCFSKVRADMETLCDQRVLESIDDKNQSGYLHTVLYFAREAHPGRLNAALSLSDGRIKMERRIRGMFRPRRTKTASAVVAVCAAVMMLTASTLTACQPTPEEPVVINKNTQAVQQVIAAAPAPVKAYEAPETVTDSFKAKDENVTITVNADVVVPGVDAFPVVSAAPTNISADFIQTAAQVLMEGKTLYKPRTGLTKQDIEAEILQLQSALADPKHSTSDGLNADDPQIVADTRKLFEDRIAIYQQQYEDAPDTLVREEAPIEFSPAKIYEDPVFYQENVNDWTSLKDDEQAQQLLDEYENEMKFVADADLDGGYYGQITASSYNGFGNRWSRLHFIKSKELNGNFMPDFMADAQTVTDMTQQEAIDLAQQTISRLGFNDMVISSVWGQTINGPDTGICGYAVQFVRANNGIPVSGSQYVENADEALYGPVYQSEMIAMLIKDGMVMSFDWQNPIEMTGTENENVTLLDFNKIMDQFRSQMSIKYTIAKLSHYSEENPDYEEYIASIKSGEINIKSIELGYMRMPVQDQPGRYRLVPVWRFYGDESVVVTVENKDLPTNMNGDREAALYLTLNAIDGSPVDEMIGY